MSIAIYDLIEFEGGPMGWYAKGHHDPAAFVDAVKAYCNAEPDVTKIRHEWWRCVPIGEKGRWVFYPATPHSRGAWEATVYDAL